MYLNLRRNIGLVLLTLVVVSLLLFVFGHYPIVAYTF